ncbi:hypothetical protein TSUD_14040 [Trifolium subterraneum]|uniref:Sieve element occlusion C-terminal domain-containing protein n=1 Tax=Trifolium subterraneum TaxID=3900 RepID=A0A2Z6NUS3_TRISU|nr:hypothetical protein TSUD_14040 [Trifolium subterraneum]
MSSSIAPASIASNVSTYHQGKTLSPLAWSDDKIFETVYITHIHTGETHNVEPLFNLTSNILRCSTALADSVASKAETHVDLIEDQVPLSAYEPPFRKLKQISSQMMSTLPGEHHAHLTTMSILKQLKSYAWNGKAIFALAAFSLEYGNFWHLVQTPTVGKSLLERLSTKGYDNKDVPPLSDIGQDIPVAVYWVIITAIICAYHLDLLMVLIFHNEAQDPLVFDCLKRQMVSIEVFRKKHVLVFISGLDSIRNEVRLLNSIYDGLQHDPSELKGYRKEDFKILWIPIVDEWTLLHKAEFDNLKLEMPWYVVEYFKPLAGIRLIREDLNYKNKPIVPVLNPQGRVVNYNAMHMIFVWGIDAFPFRPTYDESLTQKWNWFWAEMKKAFPRLQDLIKGNTFIFISGGTDSKWTQDLALAIEKIKRQEIIRKADVVIEHYHFGKEDKRIVARFWIGIESLFVNMIQKKSKDPALDQIKSLLCLNVDDWVLLSKGPNVKLLDRGDLMLATAVEFDIWKEKVFKKAGFDVAFKEYYERKKQQQLESCSADKYPADSYPGDILDPIYGPDTKCGNSMEIASVSYKCCHGHTHQKRA